MSIRSGIEYYRQLRAKLQVQQQIRLLIFDTPDHIHILLDFDEYELSWKFIVPYTDIYRMTTNTFYGLWVNYPLKHLTCHQKPQDFEYFEQLQSSKYLYCPLKIVTRGELRWYLRNPFTYAESAP